MAEALVKIPDLNWQSLEEALLVNPRFSDTDRHSVGALYASRPRMPDHLWLCSSGTSARLKIIALSRESLLNSARAVNEFVGATSQDRWLLALPTFHVGGLGILARAFLTHSGIDVLSTWNAQEFLALCHSKQITLTSLVPTQLEELCRLEHQAPASLRAIFIGGGFMGAALKQKALERGYPVLESFGMTECCSQVATEGWNRRGLEVLPLWAPEINGDGNLVIKGDALCSVIWGEGQNARPKSDGYLVTQDKVTLARQDEALLLKPLGRDSDFAKIRGENVNLLRLQEIADLTRRDFPSINDAAVYFAATQNDFRVQIIASSERPSNEVRKSFVESFNRRVLPFERAETLHFVAKIPRTSLGKVIRAEFPQLPKT